MPFFHARKENNAMGFFFFFPFFWSSHAMSVSQCSSRGRTISENKIYISTTKYDYDSLRYLLSLMMLLQLLCCVVVVVVFCKGGRRRNFCKVCARFQLFVNIVLLKAFKDFAEFFFVLWMYELYRAIVYQEKDVSHYHRE